MTRSIIGFHYSMGGNKNGIGEMIRTLNREGIPVLIKGVDDAGLCDEATRIGEEHGIENWTIFRVSKSGQRGNVEYDVPDYAKSPPAAAREHWEKTVAKWPVNLRKDKVWMEPINEPRAKKDLEGHDEQWDDLHPTDWLGYFMLEYAKIANANGFKVCGPSFNSGEPEVLTQNDYELPGMLEYLKYCAANPKKAALSVHEYIWDRWESGEGWNDWYPSLWGRVEAAFEAAKRHGIDPNFPVFVTEWGFAYQKAPRWNEARPYLEMYNKWAAKWPQIKGVAAWTLQSGWGDVDDDVQSWIGPLAGYGVNQRFPADPDPKPSPQIFVSTQTSPTPTPPVRPTPPRPTPTPSPVPTPPSPPTPTPTPPPPVKPAPQPHAAAAAGFSSSLNLSRVDLSPGEQFTGTWRFQNNGSTEWRDGVQLVYSHAGVSMTAGIVRAPMTAKTAYDITEIGAPAVVAPGQIVELTLTLTAPARSGQIASHWQLQGADGTPFGPIRWVFGTVAAGQYRYQSERFVNSVASFTRMPPGEKFTGSWVLRNNGSLPWPGNMQIAYVNQPRPETRTRIRSRMGTKTLYTLQELTGRSRVYPGEAIPVSIPFSAPSMPGSYAYHWQMRSPTGRPLNGVRWMIIDVPGAAVTPPKPDDDGPIDPPPAAQEAVAFGVNINPNPGDLSRELDQRDIDLTNQRGLGWVRYVFWASRNGRSVPTAFRKRYRDLIKTYADANIKSLLVLHQDTEWGNGPWDNGGWGIYASQFAATCAEVARVCKPWSKHVAYQIFNETDSGYGDDAPFHNPSAIGIPPKQYAMVVKAAVDAIRRVDPDATIVLGGLKTGPENAVRYLKEVAKQLNGAIPVNALAYHPYGRYVDFAPFNYKEVGKLADALAVFKQAFPGMPVWITEVGVPGHQTFLGPEHYPNIATYMREVIEEIQQNHSAQVPVVTWFAWSDASENSGIFTANGGEKAHIKDAFQSMKVF